MHETMGWIASPSLSEKQEYQAQRSLVYPPPNQIESSASSGRGSSQAAHRVDDMVSLKRDGLISHSDNPNRARRVRERPTAEIEIL
jgi:hypothetical protein